MNWLMTIRQIRFRPVMMKWIMNITALPLKPERREYEAYSDVSENTDGKGTSGFYVYDSVAKTFSLYIEASEPDITYAVLPITDSMENRMDIKRRLIRLADRRQMY